jgi:hypothetical protein
MIVIDLMHKIVIVVIFNIEEISYDSSSIQMKPVELLFAHEPVISDSGRIQNIVEGKY